MAMMNFSALLEQIAEVTKKKSYDDGAENYWKPTKDKAGNASAVIRFLPNREISDLPFVRLYTHGFKDPSTNRWYIENSLSTIGKQDLVGKTNYELWNSGIDENKELSRFRKRKLNYICNVLIIKDQEAPENEGKVKLFKFGSKIFAKITSAAIPDADLGEEPVNVFDPLEGADFLLRQTIVAGYPNYDSSKFGTKKPIAGGQKKIDEIMEQLFDLNLEVSPDKFKSEAELEKKFLWVTGGDSPKQSDYDKELDELIKIAQDAATIPVKTKKTPPVVKAEPTDAATDADNDDAAFFASLVD